MVPKQGDAYKIEDVEKFLDDGVIESETLDYKADPHIFKADDPVGKIQAITAKAVTAFGNSGGGTLLLGVGEGPNGEPKRTTPPGFPAVLGDNIAERVDRMITNATRPRVPAHVDRVLIPDTDRAYVIVDVAPRGGGPFRVVNTKDPTLDDRYFMRLGRSSLIADHYQLQQLFAQSAASVREVRDYLERRHLSDPNDVNFAAGSPAALLRHDEEVANPPRVVVTLIPEVLRGDVIDTNGARLRAVLSSGGLATDFGRDEWPTLDGRALEQRIGAELYSYVHVHRSGYIEMAHSQHVGNESKGLFLMADALHRTLESLLAAARAAYEDAGILDHVLVSVHVREARRLKLGRYSEFGTPSGTGEYRERNLSVHVSIPAAELAGEMVRVQIDRRLGEAYGLEDGPMFMRDGAKKAPSYFAE